MGTKMAVSFANNFMAETGTKLILQSATKPREWRRYIDDGFSLWDCDRKEVDRFIKRAYFHLTIKFTAEISENQITFLDNRLFRRKIRIPSWNSKPITSRHRELRFVPPITRKIWLH